MWGAEPEVTPPLSSCTSLTVLLLVVETPGCLRGAALPWGR